MYVYKNPWNVMDSNVLIANCEHGDISGVYIQNENVLLTKI